MKKKPSATRKATTPKARRRPRVKPPVPPDDELTPEELIELALHGARKILSTERQRVMAWLDSDRYGLTGKAYQNNSALAKLFHVSEFTIHDDRRKMLQAYAATLTPDHAMTLVARYFQGHDRLLAAAEKGLNEAPPGSMGHREYLKLYSDLAARQMKMAQDIGVIRKELGHLQVTEETWVAETSAEGISTVTRLGGPLGVALDEDQSPA
jgi:hypothetical protein